MEKTENQATLDVKKQMCLTVADEYSEHQFRALKVVSKFRMMGFPNWTAFYAEIKTQYPDAETMEVGKKLQQFWYMRNFDIEMIEKLEVLADNLKEEA